MPRVSTIIVSYNRLALLRRAIDSALAQTFTDQEIIVVDNCSDFDAAGELSSYGDAVRVVRNRANLGCGDARNYGASLARGEFVAFLDDDDYWKPNKLQRQIDTIGACMVSLCGQEFVPHRVYNVRKTLRRLKPHMLLLGNPICGPSGFLCRRELFDKISFDTTLRYAEDWDFLIRTFKHGEIGYVPEPLFYYTFDTSGSSMTSAGVRQTWADIQYRFVAADKHRDFLGDFNYRRRVAKITLAHLLTRTNKADFVAHSLRKAGLVATGIAATHAAIGKLGAAVHRKRF